MAQTLFNPFSNREESQERKIKSLCPRIKERAARAVGEPGWKKRREVPPPAPICWKMMPWSIPMPGLGALLHVVQPPHPPFGSKPCRPPPHTAPAPMLPTASHPLGPAVPKKLLKCQSWMASPPQGSEDAKLFLSTQPQWDHQFSNAGAHPSPSHPWPKTVVRVVHHVGTELSATLRPAEDLGKCTAIRAAKLHLPRKAPSPAARADSAACQRWGKTTAPAQLSGREAFNSQAEGVRDRWASQLTPAVTQHGGSPAPN